MIHTTIERWQMDYAPFQFPISVNEDQLVFSFATVSNTFKLSRDGMTYLLQNLYEYVDRTHAKLLYRTGKLAEFAAYINRCRATQEAEHLWRKGQQYILAHNNGTVYGVMTKYNSKPNLDVWQDICDHGLDQYAKYWTLTPKMMNVYLKYKDENGLELGLNVRNGETGHTALSYRLYVKQGDYVFSTPTYGRRKHLGKLEEVENDLTSAYAELAEVKIHQLVRESEAYKYAELILNDEKLAKVHDLVTPFHSRLRQVYALIGVLNTQRTTRGWKGVCDNALDMIYTELTKE